MPALPKIPADQTVLEDSVCRSDPHACPSCRKKFRLTYRAKQLIAYGNVALVLAFGGLWVLPDIPAIS